MAAVVRRPALVLEVDGTPGVWLSGPVARLYGDVMAATLRDLLHRDPAAAQCIRDDVMVAQALLKLGTARGTRKVPEATTGADSSWVKAEAHGDGPRRCEEERLSVADAASSAGVTPRAVRKAIASGRLTATRQGRDWSIDPADLELYKRKREAA